MSESLPTLEFSIDDWKNPFSEFLLSGGKILDIRAPVEFEEGHIPSSVNVPLLDDDQRTEIGTLYKKAGKEAAVARGFELISGAVKENRILAWKAALSNQTPRPLMTCFRGGLRSQISQRWLFEAGEELLRLGGGYKKARQFFVNVLESVPQKVEFVIISGRTGSNKTKLVEHFSGTPWAIDLEKIARHRGSAFGNRPQPQPSQSNYENQLALELVRCSLSQKQKALIFLEDESRMIGKITQPGTFFQHLRASPIIFIDEDLETRTNNIFEIYIREAIFDNNENEKTPLLPEVIRERGLKEFERFRKAFQSISKKLGGLETQALLHILDECERDFLQAQSIERNKEWIRRLLENYYDKFYMRSLEKRNPRLLYQGTFQQTLYWCQKRISDLG